VILLDWGYDSAMTNFDDLEKLLERAIENRRELLAELARERTDCYRLFSGSVEGWPGLTVDRFGSVVLVQTYYEATEPEIVNVISESVARAFGAELLVVWNHRGAHKRSVFEEKHEVEIPDDLVGLEMGLAYDVRPRHRGIDPLLFPDLRAGRRRVLQSSAGASVLNLFAYTCGVGIAAAKGGASEVWNIDFAASSLEIGRANAERNALAGQSFVTIHEDVIPALRQLSGQKVEGRRARRAFKRFEARQFDLVVLDPPRWAKSPFGAVDLVRDYQGLFKPALLTTRPGGHMLVTNNVASVDRDEWISMLKRCAAKAGRPIIDLEIIEPEGDFPSPDGRPPLKMAWLEV